MKTRNQGGKKKMGKKHVKERKKQRVGNSDQIVEEDKQTNKQK